MISVCAHTDLCFVISVGHEVRESVLCDSILGARRLTGGSGAKSGPGSCTQLMGGMSMQHLPGNKAGHFKPRPPNKMAPPRLCSRLVHLKQAPENGTEPSNRSHASHTGGANGYLSESDEQDYSHPTDSSSNSACNMGGQQSWRGRDGEQVSHTDQQQHPLRAKITP